MLLGLILAVIVPQLESSLGEILPYQLQTTATAGRATLTALCGAMFTITGVVFSTTIVALSITSAQLGPRLLRNFLGQMITQVTLGICLATSVYCLILLRQIDEFDGTVFVPTISLLIASALGVITLAVIVYYMHRVAHSMQAQNVASDVADDLDLAIRRLFPEQIGKPSEEADPKIFSNATWDQAIENFPSNVLSKVYATSDGYLQAIDDDTLINCATQQDLKIRIRVQPGDFLREEQLLLETLPSDPDSTEPIDEEIDQKLAKSFLVGNLRTTQQDVECAVNELVEIGLRALSPGVNDPFTAMTCIDRLSGALKRLAKRQMPDEIRCDAEGTPRIYAKNHTFGSIIDAAFNQLRQNSKTNVAVTLRLLEAINAIGENTVRAADRTSLLRQAEMIIESARNAEFAKYDQDAIEERYESLTLNLDANQKE